MKKGKIKYVFPGGNTSQGFHSFYQDGLKDMERIFILKGGPGTGKSTLIRKIGLEVVERGYPVEFWQCSSDNDSLDGVIIPDFKIAIIDGTAPHVVDPRYPGVVDQIINLGDHWDEEYLKAHKNIIKKLVDEISVSFQAAYEQLHQAQEAYTEWKELNTDAMDLDKVNQKTEQLMQEIFSVHVPVIRHMFASAITPRGLVNFINNITEDCKRRYILKGLPGTGKSTLIKKIAEGAVERGYQADIYHCALDPNSLDMVVIPQLGIAVLDGSSPHVEEPERTGDIVINMLDALDLGEMRKQGKKTGDIEAEYKNYMNEAISKIAQAKNLHDQLESFYIKAMDFEAVEHTGAQVLNKILSQVAKKEV
ncbi:PRK06851 family protein [Dehalobacterium formicoaceticum]|uniref:PRK06851 family protein n=1 Tax=Dehalobacterium formicoaceticum TaxID=51515 RepID=A0ABT1Y4E6_9FIRM|nr:PRK06851 family protein [Dehalobacterium formicoaceticum]MCR6545371.1 PRK06851 family protein [Dehalobacterium formicoaceticum]